MCAEYKRIQQSLLLSEREDVKREAVLVHDVKAGVGVKVCPRLFLIATLDVGEHLPLLPGRLTPCNIYLVTF
jgi:hypothetical protein